MNKSHRTKILMVGNGNWVPVCSCNWAGRDHKDANDARIEANDHQVGGLRSSSAQPGGRTVGAPKPK